MPNIFKPKHPPLHVELIGGPLDGKLMDGSQVKMVSGFLPDTIELAHLQAGLAWEVRYLIDTTKPCTPRGARRFVFQVQL